MEKKRVNNVHIGRLSAILASEHKRARLRSLVCVRLWPGQYCMQEIALRVIWLCVPSREIMREACDKAGYKYVCAHV
jgi:hypothetical protein